MHSNRGREGTVIFRFAILRRRLDIELLCYPPPPLSFPTLCPSPGVWGTVTCATQNFSVQLTVLLWQHHHPRVLPKAFQWKVVSMCKSSRSSGAGPRKFTPSWSRGRSPHIGSPLSASYAEFFGFMVQFLCLQMCVYGGSAVPQGGVGDGHLVTVPQGLVGDCLPWGGERQGGGVRLPAGQGGIIGALLCTSGFLHPMHSTVPCIIMQNASGVRNFGHGLGRKTGTTRQTKSVGHGL